MFQLHRLNLNFIYRLSVCKQRKYSSSSYLPFTRRVLQHDTSVAVIDGNGHYKYRDILYSAHLLANEIEKVLSQNHRQERIAFLCPSDSTYVSTLLACWLSGNIAVPLCTSHPESMLEYYVSNSQSKLVISHNLFQNSVKNIALKLKTNFLICKSVMEAPTNWKYFESELLENSCNSDALIIYTSGTTGQPKGVVLSHGNLDFSISSIAKAWELNANDSILHTLPLHHVHGILYALLCLLSAGGSVVMRLKFQSSEVWKYLLDSNNKINMFYGVPTMYYKLIEEYHKSYSNCSIQKQCEKIRLISSGSAALPEPIFCEWYDITGHKILERYGMSEIGMALANPLKGPRIPGTVGQPLPGVNVSIVEMKDSAPCTVCVEGNGSQVHVFPNSSNETGELLVKGPNVFSRYWNNEKATQDSFTEDGWFKTGDYAKYEDNSFKILGRTSVDIIKSGGYKISALQVESCLLSHPNIIDCSVFGIPDSKWGEKVVAMIVTKDSKEITHADVKAWCKKHLPSYSIPSDCKHVNSIPKNIMGKANKKELKAMFTELK